MLDIYARLLSAVSASGGISFAFRAIVAVLLASLLAKRGLQKKSLSSSGAVAGWVVGFTSFLVSYRFGITLIVFYQSSSWLTKYKEEEKRKLEEGHKDGGQRDYIQVLSCSLIGTIIAIAYLYFEGEDAHVDYAKSPLRSWLLCAYVGHYACCAGDTWASELGVLSRSAPILITQPWRKDIPAGTNGAISLLGTAASAAAGLCIGAVFAIGQCCTLQPTPTYLVGIKPRDFQVGYVFLGLIGGVCGSLVDSLMGATLQASYYDRDKKRIVLVHAPGAAAATAAANDQSRHAQEPEQGQGQGQGWEFSIPRRTSSSSTDRPDAPTDRAPVPVPVAPLPRTRTQATSEPRAGAGAAAGPGAELICGRDILTNEQVNALSVAVTTLICGYLGQFCF